MEKSSIVSEKSKSTVTAFREHIAYLLSVNYIFDELFAEDASHKLLESTARAFFLDLNGILNNHLLLGFTKITEPAKMRGSENLTVNFVLESIEWPDELHNRLSKLRDAMMHFRGYLAKARNKVLAHTDRSTFISGKTLGAFPEGEERKFLDNLQEFCHLLSQECLGQPFNDVSLSMTGDVLDFKEVLRKSRAYDKALSESTGEQKAWLFSLLE